jgi:hypothetical protein
MPAKGKRYAAKQSGDIQYISDTPCSHGHGFVKYTSSGGCVTCHGNRPDGKQLSLGICSTGPGKPRPEWRKPPRMVDDPSPNTLAKRRSRARSEIREKEKARRNRKREVELQRAKRRDLKMWPIVAIYNLRMRARERGIEFDLTPDDIVVPEICPVLGLPLAAGNDAPKANRPSVDRFDNNRGYTRDNIRVISRRANELKSNATIFELKAIIQYMEAGIDMHSGSERDSSL